MVLEQTEVRLAWGAPGWGWRGCGLFRGLGLASIHRVLVLDIRVVAKMTEKAKMVFFYF